MRTKTPEHMESRHQCGSCGEGSPTRTWRRLVASDQVDEGGTSPLLDFWYCLGCHVTQYRPSWALTHAEDEARERRDREYYKKAELAHGDWTRRAGMQ